MAKRSDVSDEVTVKRTSGAICAPAPSCGLESSRFAKNKGPRGCHVYHISISDVSPGAENAPVQKLRGAVSDIRGALFPVI